MPVLELPEPDATRLARSPLELVVCQVRHERKLLVGEGTTASAIHRALGGTDGPYPSISEIAGGEMAFMVGLGGGAVPQLQETKTSGWRFSSEDGSWAVAVLPELFALETTAYTTWDEDFRGRLDAVIDAIAEHVAPSFEQRIGLRYVDRITEPSVTELRGWAPYLRPELLGLVLHPELGPGVRNAQQQLVLDLGGGAEAGVRHGFVVEPTQERVDYQLDYDLYRQGGRPFAPEEIKETVAGFNRMALQLFQASITDGLLEALR